MSSRCDSVASSIEALLSTPVNLIVADLGMPEVDGFDLIDQVRRMDNGRGGRTCNRGQRLFAPGGSGQGPDGRVFRGTVQAGGRPEFLRVVDQVMRAPGAGSRAQ